VEGKRRIEGTQEDGKDTKRVEEGKKTTCRCQWLVNIAQRRACNGKYVGRGDLEK